MAKTDSLSVPKLESLLKTIRSDHPAEDPPPRDPVSQMLVSFLMWNATRDQAEQAFERVMSQVVDINELRVSHIHEIIHMVGEDYPLAEHRVLRLREALNELFIREHDVVMSSIMDKSKKEQRQFLDTLPGVPPYVAAQVTLLTFGGHAVPVDEKLVELLEAKEVVESGTPVADVESLLMRQIKADEALETHLAMQAWADATSVQSSPRSGSGRKSSRSRSGRKKTSKKRTTQTKKKK